MLTQMELNHLACQKPDCDHSEDEVLYLEPLCHPGMGIFARYDRRTHGLEILCRKCRRFVAEIAVAQSKGEDHEA